MQSGDTNSVTNMESMGVKLVDFFDVTPTSLWLEDYSELRALFERWRAEGVRDLRRFLEDDTRHVAECSACIRVLKVNQRTLTLYGAASQDELVARLDHVLRDDMLEAHVDELVQMWEGSTTFQSKSVNYSLNGRRLDILLKGVILPGHEMVWDRVLVAVDDITELEDARRRTVLSEEYARGIFEHAPVSLWVEDFEPVKDLLDELRDRGITDLRTFTDVHPEFVERCMAEIQVLDVNQHTLEMLKANSKAELLNRLSEVFRGEMRHHFREQLIDLWEGKLFHTREVINYALDGEPVNIHLQFSVFPGHERHWDLVLIALTDITARKKAEAYLEFLGKHDVLTKLKNRSFYVDELNRLQRKGPFPVSVIMIDVNDLKKVNDQLGHAAGDEMLRRAGEVLMKVSDRRYHAARIGGDEFAVLLPGLDARGGEQVVEQIGKLIELNNQFYTGTKLSFSMGTATCDGKERLEDTIKRADLAMYESKRARYNTENGNRRAGN